MVEKVIIQNPEKLKELKQNFKQEGISKIHVLADFDRTLTKAFKGGEKVGSIIAELRNKNYINEEYSKKAHELYDKYHPIEINPNISLEEKKKKMDEWWEKHLELLINSKLNKEHLKKIIKSGEISLRENTNEFLKILNKQKIPLIIISANGLGKDSIELLLKEKNLLYENISIISNTFIWDDKGNSKDYKRPIIHVFNKDETVLKEIPEIYEKIQERKNVILMGDSLGDLGMIEGFDYDNLIKIGFLNEKVKEHLEVYKKNFDIVIPNDGDFEYINKFLEEITK